MRTIRPMARLRLAATALATLTLTTVAACGGGGDSGGGTTTPPPTPTPTIGVSLSAASASAQAGQSANVAVTVARNNGFASAIDLTVEGAPTGVTATFAPASVPNTSTASSLTLATAATTAPGTYSLVVRARGTGVADVTAPLTLTVTAPPPPPAFTLALAAPAVTIQQGANATVRATVARSGGFTGPVALTVTGLPAGATVPSTLSITGDTLSIPITVGASTVAGNYSLTVSATGSGVTAQSTPLQLTVSQAPPATASFTISATPASLTLGQGGSADITVNINRTNFTGGVTLTASTNIAGPTFIPPAAPVTTNQGTITVTVPPTFQATSFPITVRASAPGFPDQLVTVQATVTVVAAGTFALAVAPTALTLQQGGQTTTQLTITRSNGFTNPVTISTGTLPTGVQAFITPANPIVGSTATITLTASATAPVAPFTLTLNGAAIGATGTSATATVNLTAAPTNNAVTFAYGSCQGVQPIWVGFQNGQGPWQRASAGAGGTYNINIGASGGVAVVTPNGAGYNVVVYFGSASELNAYGARACDQTGGKSVTGAVTGLGTIGQATVSLGSSTTTASTAAPTYSLRNVPAGPRDLLASRSSFTGGAFTVDKVILRRGINPADGDFLPALDFEGAEAFAPAAANVTIANAGSDLAFPAVSYVTGNGTSAAFFSGAAAAASATGGVSPATQRYVGIPSAQQQAGDLHQLTVLALPTANGSPDATSFRAAVTYFRTVADRNVTLGAVLNTPIVTIGSTLPYPRPRVVLAAQSDYDQLLTATFSQTVNAAPRNVTMFVSAGYFGTPPSTWDVTLPDFTSAGSFQPVWGLQAGQNTAWTVLASGGTATQTVAPTEGTTYRIGLRSGSLNTRAAAYRR